MSEAAATLAAAGIEGARYEARLLVAAASGLDGAGLLREPERLIEPAALRTMVARRAGREPMAFILGWQEFWSLRFAVSPATLIPRADSETLIEAVVTTGRRFGRVLDLGTGTGCLLLAALSVLPEAWGVGIDRNPAAAQLAQRNARALGLADRCALLAADWAAPLQGRFDLLLSNPPYIPTAAVPGLMPEVSRFEPVGALDGGEDGMAAYRVILGQLGRLLMPDGLAILELGAGQAEAVRAAARRAGFARTETRRDLAGIERALLLWAG